MWQTFKSWYSQPFRSDMSAAEWFMFIGLLVIITLLWGIILRHIRGLD